MTKPTERLQWCQGATITNILTGLTVKNITYIGKTPVGMPYALSTVRYEFDGTPDLSSVLLGHSLVIENATNIENNGTYDIININIASFYVDVINTNRVNISLDEALSPATAIITTSAPTLSNTSTSKQQQGYKPLETPSEGDFNYKFFVIGKWIDYLKDEFSGLITDYNAISDLKAVNTTSLDSGNMAYIKELDSIYRLDKTITIDEDIEYLIAPTTGTGRWVLFLPSLDYISNSFMEIRSFFEQKTIDLNNKNNDLEQRIKILEQKHQDLYDILKSKELI